MQYQSKRDYVAADFASRTMRWTGIIVLLFLIFHLIDLTWGHGELAIRARRSVQQPRSTACNDRRSRSSTAWRTIALGVPPVPRRLVACSRAWGSTTRAINKCGAVRASASPALILIGNLSFPIAVQTARRRACSARIRSPPQHRVQGGTDHDRLDSQASPTGRSRRSGTTTSSTIKLVNPANKRRFDIIVVGTGLAGASAAASLAELGYNVKVVTFHDSPRRAHSIAAQGGINAAKNYKNDGDSIYRLFYDTIKGGDYRAREANVYRLAQVSRRHHRPVRRAGRAVRARVRRPARQPLVRWRAGVAHVLRAWPDRPAAAARRVPGADARRCTSAA